MVEDVSLFSYYATTAAALRSKPRIARLALPATQRQPVTLGWRAKSSTIVLRPMVRITDVIRGIERSEIPLDGRIKEEDPCSGGALPRLVGRRGGVRRGRGCSLRDAE